MRYKLGVSDLQRDRETRVRTRAELCHDSDGKPKIAVNFIDWDWLQSKRDVITKASI